MARRIQERDGSTIVGLALGGVGFAGLATAAGACCTPVVAPLVVAALGAGGAAWAASLGPWSPWLLVASAGLLGLAHWRSRHGCAGRRRRLVRGVPWLATIVWLVAAAVHFWALAAQAP